MTQDLLPVHFHSIIRSLGHMVLDAQETLRVITRKYHHLFPLFLEEGSRKLPLI
jgi:hypothetical protein